MTNSAEPTAILSHLHRTDGSATFTFNGYTVIGAVNGPLEISRRDELPEEAAVDVLVRPAAGVGGMKAMSVIVNLSNLLHTRYTGTSSRINSSIYSPSNYTHPQFPSNTHPNYPTNYEHARE